MALVIKGFNGFDYKLKNGKMLSFKGGGYLNELSKDDFDLLCKEYPSFKNAVEKGFFIFNANKSDSNRAVDDTLQSVKDKQETAQKANEARTGTKIKKG